MTVHGRLWWVGLAWLACAAWAWAAPLSWTVSDREGLPQLRKGGVAAMSAEYVFWGPNWDWAPQSSRLERAGAGRYRVSGRNEALGLRLSASVEPFAAQQSVWTWRIDAARERDAVIGGGVVFKFDLAAFGGELGAPTLLPDRRGWTWGRDAERVEFRFDEPVAELSFEGGRLDELRAYFYRDRIASAPLHLRAVMTASPGVRRQPTIAEREGLDDPALWPVSPVDANVAPVDLSFLNAADRPAGRRGFVRAQGARLVFEDGSPARFWGTNVNAYALFSSDAQQVRAHARRLSQLGYNLVRLHHHDSLWVSPNVFGDDRRGDTQSLHPAAMARLDWWIKSLRDEGIYVWLDLHVGRALKRGDRIEAFDEIRKGAETVDLRGYNYVNASIQAAMARFNAAYLSHRNPHTGLRYLDDPAVVAVMLSNENDLTTHFGNALLPDKGVPRHNAWYSAAADRFAAQHGLVKDRVWRSWEHGPSKLFLNDLEHEVQRAQLLPLRALGLKAPVVSTSFWGDSPLSSIPALQAGDINDVHAYARPGEIERHPRYKATLIHTIALAHVANRPLTVSEWNMEPFPLNDRHSLPLYVAASASHQGWDAMLHFAYAQEALVGGQGGVENWHSYNDPALLATLPAAALLYRRGDVDEARTTYVFAPTAADLFDTVIDADRAPGLRIAAERGKLVIALPEVRQLPWLRPTPIPLGARRVDAFDARAISPDADEVVSDHGQIRRNWAQGWVSVDTPRTQSLSGWLGGGVRRLADLRLQLRNLYATVAVQSLDDQPIHASRDLLISMVARVVPGANNQLPFRVEPLSGTLDVRARAGLTVHAVDPASGRLRALPTRYQDGHYQIDLGAAGATQWLRLR